MTARRCRKTRSRALRKQTGLEGPQPTLTLSPVSNQRRASRHVTEYHPGGQAEPSAWTGTYHNEARELTAFDRIRDDKPARPGSGAKRRGGGAGAGAGRRGRGGEVNGNVARPAKAGGNRKRSGGSKRVAPGQELPSVRTWFAGDSRGNESRGNGGGAGAGNNRGGNRGNAKPGRGGSGRGKPGGGSGGGARGQARGGNR